MPIQFYLPRSVKERQKTFLSRRGQTVGLSLLLGLGAALLADWGASRAVQSMLLQKAEQIDQRAAQKHLHFSHGAAKTGGWPWGAWMKLPAPSLEGTTGPYEYGAAGQKLWLGGTWLDWLKSSWRGKGFPAQLEGNALFRVVKNHTHSLTLRTRQLHLTIQSLEHEQTQQIGFQINQVESGVSGFNETLRLNRVSGQITVHPDPYLTKDFTHTPANRLALYLTADRGELSQSTFLQHFFSGVLVGTALAAGQLKISHAVLGIGVSGDGSLAEFPAGGPWRIRLQEAACDFPVSLHGTLQTAQPRLTLTGQLSLPGGRGDLTARLEYWRALLISALQQSAVQNALTTRQKTLLSSDLTPAKDGRPESPLSLTIPLQHGRPAALTPDRLELLQNLNLSDLTRHFSFSP